MFAKALQFNARKETQKKKPVKKRRKEEPKEEPKNRVQMSQWAHNMCMCYWGCILKCAVLHIRLFCTVFFATLGTFKSYPKMLLVTYSIGLFLAQVFKAREGEDLEFNWSSKRIISFLVCVHGVAVENKLLHVHVN